MKLWFLTLFAVCAVAGEAQAKFEFAVCIANAQSQCAAATCQALGHNGCGVPWVNVHEVCTDAAIRACTAEAIRKLKLGKPEKK